MLNKVMLIGYVGKDVELRYTPAGAPIANFSLATSERWKSKTGEKVEKTEWHKIVAFNKLAEICGEYLTKGKLVYIEGKVQTRSWEDKDGIKRYSTEIVANNMTMLGGSKTSSANTGNPVPSNNAMPSASSAGDMDMDDVPF